MRKNNEPSSTESIETVCINIVSDIPRIAFSYVTPVPKALAL